MQGIKQALAQNQQDRAIGLCRAQIQEQARFSVEYQKILGRLYIETQRLDEAEMLYRSALEVREQDWAKVGLARVKQSQGFVSVALEWLDTIVRDSPLCLEAYDLWLDICESQDDPEQAQKVLFQSVQISPMALARQQRLADLAYRNHDTLVATEAYKRSVRLGRFSCLDHIDIHLNLGRTTAALYAEGHPSAGDYFQDACQVLDEALKRQGIEPEQKTQVMLISSRLYAGSGNKRYALEQFSQGDEMYVTLVECAVGTDLDKYHALKANEKEADAERFIKHLQDKYQADEQSLQALDEWLDEPVSQENKRKVSAMNNEGIGLYEAGKLDEALMCFHNARRLFPNHIGVRLNLVQTLVGQIHRTQKDNKAPPAEALLQSQENLDKVERLITPNSKQYGRYQKLGEKVRLLADQVKST